MITNSKIKHVRDAIYKQSNRKIGTGVAKELLMLAGGNAEIVINASINSEGLDQCKASIINERFALLEDFIDSKFN